MRQSVHGAAAHRGRWAPRAQEEKTAEDTSTARRRCDSWEGGFPRMSAPPDAGRRSTNAYTLPAGRSAFPHGKRRDSARRAARYSLRAPRDRSSGLPASAGLSPQAIAVARQCGLWVPQVRRGVPSARGLTQPSVWGAEPWWGSSHGPRRGDAACRGRSVGGLRQPHPL